MHNFPKSASGVSSSLSDRSQFEAGSVPIEKSGWTATHGLQAKHRRLEQDIETDIAIVGAGLAGSSLALHLAESNINVALVEARQPGWGASGRNAGHVLPMLRDPKLISRFPDGGKAFFELFREHHTITFDLAKKYQIDCDATQSGYLNAAVKQKHLESETKQANYWEKEQGQAIDYLGAAEMKTLTGSEYFKHGILYKDGGRVNPYLFTNGMIDNAARLGASVYGDSEVISLTKTGARWKLKTAAGSVSADRVVFCTNAYPNKTVPEFTGCYYPLTAYGLSTKPLSKDQQQVIMPGKSAMAQYPIDLNPFVVDAHGRIITSLLPSKFSPENAQAHFKHHLRWIHRTWPESKDFNIELDHYWTGRAAMRNKEFPGVFEVASGVYGLMHFNAWGNIMAPLMGKLFADGLKQDRMDHLPFPLESPEAVKHPGKQEFLIRHLMIPAGKLAQKLGLL